MPPAAATGDPDSIHYDETVPLLPQRPVVRVLISLSIVGLCTGCGDSPATESSSTLSTAMPVAEAVDGVPTDVPASLVPEGAEVSGLIAAAGGQGSSAAEFSLDGTVDREMLSANARAAAEAEGWLFLERVYDPETMVMTFTRDQSTMTWTVRLTETGAAGSVIVVGSD